MQNSKLNNILLVISAVVVAGLILFALFRDNSQPISAQKALQLLRSHKVSEVVLSEDYAFLKVDKTIYKIPRQQLASSVLADQKIKIDRSSNIALYIFLFIVVIGFASMVFRWWQKQQEKPVKLKESKTPQEESLDTIENEPIEALKSDVSFDDIGGIEDVKEELLEIIDFLKNPKKYKNFGARLPRGVLLVGPPGVGKTMIAKAVAKEAGVSFYYQSGASFVQIYVGMGAKRVHDLFSAAKKNAPSIIFIDEIDAVGKKRDGNRSDEREATLNQLLTEMDGFESQSGVIVIAATNKIDVLDSALLRAGRFDRRVFVDLPTKKERAAILEKYLSKIPNDVDVEKIASITVGFNGATLASFVNEATLLALRKNNSKVTMEHFYAVKDKVMFGKKKLLILNEKQKAHRISYQSAKVLVATYFDLPFEKLLLSNERLTPPNQDDSLLQSEIEARIKTLLAGVVYCDMKYAEHASSAKSDLDDVKEMIDAMVDRYGMGEELLGSQEAKTQLLTRLYQETKELLTSMQTLLEAIEAKLEQNESITKQEVKEIIKQ